MRFAANPFAERSAYTPAEARIVSRESAVRARDEISTWTGYESTPLRVLRGLAERAGVGVVLYKDESKRLSRGSFKALGGAYAATLKLRDRGGAGEAMLCCATDGNHGQSVAFAAKQHGCSCVVFMHEHAPADKVAAIRALDAKVITVRGTYDDAVSVAAKTAEMEGWLLIPDTSDNPHDETTLRVMQGYGVMVLELLEQFKDTQLPTHVLVQAGVGGLAASVAGVFSDVCGKLRPTMIVVEPEAAACLLESNLRLGPARVPGDLRTEMAMLSTGAASAAAWPILERRIDGFLAIEDSAALSARERLTAPRGGDAPVDVGVSGAAGVAGLIEICKNPRLAKYLELTANARVLVFGTEQGDQMFCPPCEESP